MTRIKTFAFTMAALRAAFLAGPAMAQGAPERSIEGFGVVSVLLLLAVLGDDAAAALCSVALTVREGRWQQTAEHEVRLAGTLETLAAQR